MTIGMDKMEALRAAVKSAFDIASVMDVNRPEAVAILMKSGLILSGYTQPKSVNDDPQDAARDALRAVIPSFPESAKAGSKALDHFTIAAVIVLTARQKIQASTLNTLKEYPAVLDGAQVFHAKLGSGSDKNYVGVHTVIPLENHI